IARDALPGLDGLLAEDIGEGVVHGIDGKQFVAAAVPDRLAVLALARPQEGVGVAAIKTGDLQLDIVLVRPEPGRGVVVFGNSEHGTCRMLALIDGVLHGFEPRALAAVWKVRTVAHGKDIGRRGAGLAVDSDAVINAKSRALRQIIVRQDADTDDRDISLDRLAVLELRTRKLPIPAGERLQAGRFTEGN